MVDPTIPFFMKFSKTASAEFVFKVFSCLVRGSIYSFMPAEIGKESSFFLFQVTSIIKKVSKIFLELQDETVVGVPLIINLL